MPFRTVCLIQCNISDTECRVRREETLVNATRTTNVGAPSSGGGGQAGKSRLKSGDGPEISASVDLRPIRLLRQGLEGLKNLPSVGAFQDTYLRWSRNDRPGASVPYDRISSDAWSASARHISRPTFLASTVESFPFYEAFGSRRVSDKSPHHSGVLARQRVSGRGKYGSYSGSSGFGEGDSGTVQG